MNWFEKANKQAGYLANIPQRWSIFYAYAEDLLDEANLKFESDYDPGDIFNLIAKIFKEHAKIVFLEARENPSDERSLNIRNRRLEKMCDSVLAVLENGFSKWLYRHDDFNGWWSEFAYHLLTNGGDHRFDIRDEIVQEAERHVSERVDKNEIYQDVLDGGFDDYSFDYLNDDENAKRHIADLVVDTNKADVVEFIHENDIKESDFQNHIREFAEYNGVEDDVASMIAWEMTYDMTNWIVEKGLVGSHIGDMSFEDVRDMYGDGSDNWIEIVKTAAKKYGMKKWVDYYPGMTAVENGVRGALKRMQEADSVGSKVAAISHALDVKHYHGKMMDDHLEVDGGQLKQIERQSLEEMIPLTQEQLDRLSALDDEYGLLASFKPGLTKTAGIASFKELREKRTQDGGRHYLFEGDYGYYVNRIPYYGDIYQDPSVFYGIVSDETGERGKKVGVYNVNRKKIDEVIDGPKEEDKSYVDNFTVDEVPDELKKETQPDLPLFPPPGPSGHWASVDGVKTADTIWTQSQVFCEDGSCYDIEKLIEETENNRVERIDTDSLKNMLFVDAWGDREGRLSPMEVLNNPNGSPDNMRHMARIRTANREKPLICRFYDGKLIDGYHRLARAVLDGAKKVNVVFAQDEQMKKAKIT